MRAYIAAVLFGLELPEGFKRKNFCGIKLEKEGNQVRNLKDTIVRDGAGSAQHNDFLSNPCFYVNTQIESSANRLKDLSDEMLFLRGIIQNILLSFWLVKDNSITSDLVISKSQDDFIAFNRASLMFSNSSGEYDRIKYTADDLKECLEWLKLLISNTQFDEEENDKEKAQFVDGTILFNTNKKFPYEQSNRLQRAIRFVVIARSDSFLPAKITFYISALESLLSASNIELRMQVADRSARIIGDTFEEKIRVNKIVSIAYSFRSSYIHGSVNSAKNLKKTLKPYETVEGLVSELDEVLRTLLKTFLTDLNYVTKMNDEEFAKWIKKLLYK